MVSTPPSEPSRSKLTTTPADVAELFGWLDMDPGKYREFPLPEESPAFQKPAVPPPAGRSAVSRSVSHWPNRSPNRIRHADIPRENALERSVSSASHRAGWAVSSLLAMFSARTPARQIPAGVICITDHLAAPHRKRRI